MLLCRKCEPGLKEINMSVARALFDSYEIPVKTEYARLSAAVQERSPCYYLTEVERPAEIEPKNGSKRVFL